MTKVAIIGSINIDLVVQSARRPGKGETILGDKFSVFPGGKGANQAVAASRLGADAILFGTVGEDLHGQMAREFLGNESVHTSYLHIDPVTETGVAVIQISEGDNSIIVVPGANAHTTIEYLQAHLDVLLQADVFLVQLEIPLVTVEWLVDTLHAHHKTIILNPAPAVKLSENLIEKATYLTPNEHECRIIFNSQESLESLMQRYPNKLIVTEGEKGVRYHNGTEIVHTPCIQVEVVDTTGAGDSFNGALAVALAEGQPLDQAVAFANIAAGLSVTRYGAQSGMATREQIHAYINR